MKQPFGGSLAEDLLREFEGLSRAELKREAAAARKLDSRVAVSFNRYTAKGRPIAPMTSERVARVLTRLDGILELESIQ